MGAWLLVYFAGIIDLLDCSLARRQKSILPAIGGIDSITNRSEHRLNSWANITLNCEYERNRSIFTAIGNMKMSLT